MWSLTLSLRLRWISGYFFQFICLCLLMAGSAHAVGVTLAWDQTIATDLAGYNIYYRTCSAGSGCSDIGAREDLSGLIVPLGNLSDPGAPQYRVEGLPADCDFVFVVTAYTDTGLESGFSNAAIYRAAITEPDGGGADAVVDGEPPTTPAKLTSVLQTSNNAVVLNWAASTDNVGVARYAIYRDGVYLADSTVNTYTDAGLVPGVTYQYTIAAIDTAGNQSAESAPLAVILPIDAAGDPSGEPAPTDDTLPAEGSDVTSAVIRVNCGGSRYKDPSGNIWAADDGFNTGRTSGTSASIANTTLDTLYQSKRWDPSTAPELEYRFDLPDGEYLVNLHFAETWSGAFGINKRKFHVSIEGQLVQRDLDIYAEVGANAALVLGYKAQVTDGRLEIKFVHSVENPQINAIEVLTLAANQDLQAPPAPQQLQADPSPAGDSVTLSWTAVNDVGGSGIDGYTIYRDGSQIGYTSQTHFVDNTVRPDRSYTYEVSAVDKAFNESTASAAVQVSTAVTSDNRITLRVNVGGPAHTDRSGQYWVADTGYNTGKASKKVTAIAGTLDDTLYHTKRYDPVGSPEMVYRFQAPNGDYTVKLHFAETWKGAFGDGLRRFDVKIEGGYVVRGLDIFASVGSDRALVKSYAVTVTDGYVDIGFLHRVENPIVNAIEILPRN